MAIRRACIARQSVRDSKATRWTYLIKRDGIFPKFHPLPTIVIVVIIIISIRASSTPHPAKSGLTTRQRKRRRGDSSAEHAGILRRAEGGKVSHDFTGRGRRR